MIRAYNERCGEWSGARTSASFSEIVSGLRRFGSSTLFIRRTFLCLFAVVAFGLGGARSVHAQGGTSPSQLPRLHLADFQYEGAFRLPADTFGASSLNYSEGPIEYNSGNHSLYIVGHGHHQAIAEFAVPALVNSTNLGDLNMAGNPRQVFATVLDRVPGGNPQNINESAGWNLWWAPTGRSSW